MNELALLPNTIVVPDSVEPYIGYKWLQTNGDQLRSYHQMYAWPPGQPLEAQCAADWGWQWTAAPTHEAQQVSKGTYTAYDNNSRLTNTRIWLVNDIQLAEKPPKKPKLLLPPGLAWSYEPLPCPHDPVAEDCSCGIYAAKDQKTAARYRRSQAVLVRVALWGRVIIGDKGARGQYAYPQEILDTTGRPGLMEKVGEAYGIPFPGKTAAKPTPPIPTAAEIKPTTVPARAWHSPGRYNPGRTNWADIIVALFIAALALAILVFGVALTISPWMGNGSTPIEIALIFGPIFVAASTVVGQIAGDMFCEGCGRRGLM